MPEVYTLHIAGDQLNFTPRKVGVPAGVFASTFDPAQVRDLGIVARMGDPDLLQCIVFKRDSEAGGIFAMHDKNGLLFAAVAETALVYAIAMGFFGEMTANARYGVDIFENLELPND